MSQFKIIGGNALEGEIEIKGAKNAALPILAAALLTNEKSQFYNVPRIRDVLSLLELFDHIGVTSRWISDTSVEIDPSSVDHTCLTGAKEIVEKLRASILVLGPLFARFDQVEIPYPGGCVLGKRSLDAHLSGIQMLGAEVKINDGDTFLFQKTKDFGGKRIYLREASVTATENLLMVATITPGETIILNAAAEPHVENLCDVLVSMGAEIRGAGTNILTVIGKKSLHGVEATIIPDQLEVGSFAVATAVTRGHVIMKNVDPNHLDPILLKLDDAGVPFVLGSDTLEIRPVTKLRGFSLTTNIWPGFPTDLQAPFTVLATQSEGNSMIHDWMFEGRLFYIDKLLKMGANIIMADPHRIIVTGKTMLHGKQIESPDIRAGIALLIAALSADGESIIEHAEVIDRGYMDIDKRVQTLGGDIVRVENSSVR